MGFELHDGEAFIAHMCAKPTEMPWVEFKVNTYNPDSIGKYISGMANAAMLARKPYAFMIWGVQDITHEIVGTEIRLDQAKGAGNVDLLFWLSQHLRPRIHVAVEHITIGDKQIEMLVIDPGYQQPVAFNGQEYIRVGTSLTPLREHVEKQRAIWQITTSYSFESTTLLPHASAAEIFSQFEVSKFLSLLGAEGRTPESMIETLVQKGLINDNMQGGYEVKCLLGMCCAKDMDRYPELRHKAPRVIVYKGTNNSEALGDTEGKKGYAVGFKPMFDFVMGSIPSREEMRHGLRNKIYDVPDIAIREFLANAIVHQDFTVPGQRPLVEVYKDRVRILNAGEPLIDVERFIDGGTQTRNPDFARLMRDARICEQRGSGVDRAVKEIERETLPAPLFVTHEGTTSVTIYKRRAFADMTPEERVRACFQHAQLKHEENQPMNNASLRHRFGLPDRAISQVTQVIRDAQDAGKIKPLDPNQGNKFAKYVPRYE
jgi:ATP-dependent DNA helicase RecG